MQLQMLVYQMICFQCPIDWKWLDNSDGRVYVADTVKPTKTHVRARQAPVLGNVYSPQIDFTLILNQRSYPMMS